MIILGDGCGYFSVLKNCYSKKVFKGRLVVVPCGTHRSNGKIYHNYYKIIPCDSTLGVRKYDQPGVARATARAFSSLVCLYREL